MRHPIVLVWVVAYIIARYKTHRTFGGFWPASETELIADGLVLVLLSLWLILRAIERKEKL